MSTSSRKVPAISHAALKVSLRLSISISSIVTISAILGSQSEFVVASALTATPASLPDCEGFLGFIGDGYCDVDNNNAECGYDGGDCCPCTCVDSIAFMCGLNGGYDCRDPSVPASCAHGTSLSSVPSTSSFAIGSASTTHSGGYTQCYHAGGHIPFVGDGYCDSVNSIPECHYDGGDCCSCTCVDTEDFACGVVGYDCHDPSVSTACKDDSNANSPAAEPDSTSTDQYPNCPNIGGHIPYIGDGDCDVENNNAECDYDGGDCCSCSCVDTELYTCGENGFKCQDPTVPPSCSDDA